MRKELKTQLLNPKSDHLLETKHQLLALSEQEAEVAKSSK
jgi:hypothetical protein